MNTIVGSGIFGIPSLLNGVVGRGSPWAMLLAGAAIGLTMACCAEVASRFSEPGGAYLYSRAAFGRFAGIQIGWFSWLAPMGTSAAAANLFTTYVAGFVPFAATTAGRVMVIGSLFAFLAIANCLGVRVGANLSSVFTVAKLLPLVLLIALGLIFFAHHPETYRHASPAPNNLAAWADAMLLLAFAYGGFENAILPAGEIKDVQRTLPFALGTGLVLCILVYGLIQFVAVATIGTGPVERPLGAAAEILIGRGGGAFIALAAMISTFGHLSAVQLATPRLTFALAQRRDFPAIFARLHRRFQTPYVSILVFGGLTSILAVSGTFRWAIAMASGALIVIYSSICASLIRFRQTRVERPILRLPFGRAIACLCILIGLVLLARLTWREGFLLLVTFAIAAVHWALTKESVPIEDAATQDVSAA